MSTKGEGADSPEFYVYDDADNCRQGALFLGGGSPFAVNVQPGKEVAVGAFWRPKYLGTLENTKYIQTCSVIMTFSPLEGATYEAVYEGGTSACLLRINEINHGSTRGVGTIVSGPCERNAGQGAYYPSTGATH